MICVQNQIFKEIKFRKVKMSDAKDLLDIYNFYIENTVATFEYDTLFLDEFTSRIEDICKEYPYIVCEYKDKIIGYAYAHQFKSRQAYRWSSELTIYLHKDYLGLGIGKKFYSLLIEILKLQNVKVLYGCVTSNNEKSIKLHEKLGFDMIGVYHNSGYKMEQWLDVTWFEKFIGNQEGKPEQFINFNDLDQELIDTILI